MGVVSRATDSAESSLPAFSENIARGDTGMSPGEISGIVAGVICAVSLVCFIFFYRGTTSRLEDSPPPSPVQTTPARHYIAPPPYTPSETPVRTVDHRPAVTTETQPSSGQVRIATATTTGLATHEPKPIPPERVLGLDKQTFLRDLPRLEGMSKSTFMI